MFAGNGDPDAAPHRAEVEDGAGVIPAVRSLIREDGGSDLGGIGEIFQFGVTVGKLFEGAVGENVRVLEKSFASHSPPRYPVGTVEIETGFNFCHREGAGSCRLEGAVIFPKESGSAFDGLELIVFGFPVNHPVDGLRGDSFPVDFKGELRTPIGEYITPKRS